MPPKRRRRFQGLYYHSSPPKVLPMNGQASNQGRKRRDGDDFSVKLSTIRIWMHEKDIGKLTRILWAGQGSRLCQQASTNPRVKRFLAAVPYVMNSIKDVHQAVIDNNLETLQAKMEPPVPPALITCRDANGLNLIHKAAGLGHTKILEYLIGIWPDGVAETDITGKTPLHWAASHKNNMRCYTLLTQTGCDEEAMDYKMKSPTYYRHKPNDIERAFLVYVPEAPRVSPDVATDWEALSEDVGDGGKKLDIKIPDTNGIHGHIIDESIENISEVDLNDGISATEEEQPATPITNGTASDSIPQTPVKDDDNDEPADEEDGEGAIPVNENAETEAINGNANGETEEVEAEAEDETASEAAEEAAEPEVEAIEGETNMKTLNEPTTTTNERDEHAQQGENETTTATAESKNLTESESTKDAETKPEEKEIEEATKVEAGATEREEKKESDVLVEAGDETINENEESSGEKEDEKAVEKADEKEDEKVVGDVGKATEAEEEQKVGDGIKENSSNEKDEEEVDAIGNALALDPRIGGEGEEAQASVDELLNKEVAAIELKTTKSDEKLVNESKENAKECGSKMGEDNERDEDTKNLNESTSVVDNNDKGTASEEAKVIEEKSKEVGQVDKEGNIEQSKQEKGVENGNEIKENENEEKLDKESMGKRISKENEEMKDNENETVEKEKGEQINNESEVSKIAENAFKVVEGEKEEADDENMKDETYEKQKMLDKVAGNKDVNDENEKEKLDEKDKEKEQEKEKESEQEKTKETLDGKTTGERTDTAIENLVEHKNEIIDEKKSSMSEESVIENEGETDNNPQSAQLHTTEPENNDNSNKNGAKEKTNQGALKVNNKTEEDVKNEIDQKPNNSKEIAINNNSIESETITVNGERKRTVKADKETGEKVSIATPESRGEKINETNEQKSGKMPRLTTAKAMRGRRNGSATKRNGSAKKKNDALIEGDNESEDDDDEEDEPNNEQATELVAENENTIEYESEPEKALDSDAENDVYVVTGPQTADKLDENYNEDKYDNVDGSSPTSSLAIEGFVAGASEDNRVQSQSAAYVHEESDITKVINSGDMEQLAQIVLNGDGNKLVNMQSQNPDIQAFLSNVPSYMSKIRRVHEAAREGSLLALQQALDRRKFAIAKDEISPNGATPLHVAVLFGNTDIVRYLAARFPETTTIADTDGRTALHYAAVINDNGHFYNVLTQLGANSKAADKLGHTPEFYQHNEEAKEILNYRQLLSNFGAEELEDELLNDQGQVENASSQLNPIFKTEQGKYLANNLADPLIKALTEIANKRPEDPVAFLANYLQNYLHQRDPIEASNSGKTNSTAPIRSNSPLLRRTGMGSVQGVYNGNGGDEDRIEEDHIPNVDEEDDEETHANLDDRDEHGQSMLHFACARSHRRGALMHLIEESNIDITYRDELYRTARDVSLQANQPSNAKDIDRYVLSLAVIGDVKPFETLAVEGYDHIVDVTDDNEVSIVDIAAERGHEELADFLRNLRTLEELREELHQMIRDGNVGRAKEIVADPNGKWLLKAKNYYGRTALHIAVLKENEELVEHFVSLCSELLKIGDNLERTALHYAMGTNIVESLNRILIQKGAKRTTKDLKGRQPTYYFMNKADILRLQEEEEENR